MQRGVAAADWSRAASTFGWIRALMAIDLTLGLITLVVAAAGPTLIGG
ncbi:MAG: hypothetical protein LJE61_00320 [Thiocapsa sp.]|jgi:uncharacterized membrane protein|nr:hypothetical protein [Thiocapsa sp.]MCG6897222.1 hypothetical protein [Thiocapsa sp.]MCG6983634.1 hypothetical protein [Thiocapsa sp.]